MRRGEAIGYRMHSVSEFLRRVAVTPRILKRSSFIQLVSDKFVIGFAGVINRFAWLTHGMAA